MRLVDWREAPVEDVAAALQEECDDVAGRARLGPVGILAGCGTGAQPGTAAGLPRLRDRGRPAGWTLFSSPRLPCRLARSSPSMPPRPPRWSRASFAAPEARGASMVLSFTRAQAPGLADELRAQTSTPSRTGTARRAPSWSPVSARTSAHGPRATCPPSPSCWARPIDDRPSFGRSRRMVVWRSGPTTCDS